MIADFIHIFKEYYITACAAKSAIFEICGKLFRFFCRKKGPAAEGSRRCCRGPVRQRFGLSFHLINII